MICCLIAFSSYNIIKEKSFYIFLCSETESSWYEEQRKKLYYKRFFKTICIWKMRKFWKMIWTNKKTFKIFFWALFLNLMGLWGGLLDWVAFINFGFSKIRLKKSKRLKTTSKQVRHHYHYFIPSDISFPSSLKLHQIR